MISPPKASVDDFLREIETALKYLYLCSSSISKEDLKTQLEAVIGGLVQARNHADFSFNALTSFPRYSPLHP